MDKRIIANELLKIAKGLVAKPVEVDEKKELQLYNECCKLSVRQCDKHNIEIEFIYSIYGGLKANIGIWSGGYGNSFDNAIAYTEEGVKVLKKAKKDYAKLIALKEKLGLPGKVEKM